jgi:NUMOD4 motif
VHLNRGLPDLTDAHLARPTAAHEVGAVHGFGNFEFTTSWFQSLYEVSNFGRVRGLKRGGVLSPYIDTNPGYPRWGHAQWSSNILPAIGSGRLYWLAKRPVLMHSA